MKQPKATTFIYIINTLYSLTPSLYIHFVWDHQLSSEEHSTLNVLYTSYILCHCDNFRSAVHFREVSSTPGMKANRGWEQDINICYTCSFFSISRLFLFSSVFPLFWWKIDRVTSVGDGKRHLPAPSVLVW